MNFLQHMIKLEAAAQEQHHRETHKVANNRDHHPNTPT